MKYYHHWTLEYSLYALALVLALAVRLFNLGAAPLSDSEAGWALQALEIARGAPAAVGPQPVYVLFTSLLFSLFSATNFLARFLPALMGGLLILLPSLFRGALGRTAALILAFGLALDPGLATVSRTAGGPVLALAFGLLALGTAYAGRAPLAGILTGLALLSGPGLLHGALGFALAWSVGRWLERAGVLDPVFDELRGAGAPLLPGQGRVALYWLAGALLLAATFFLRTPQGLGAFAGTLPAYLSGWTAFSGVPASSSLAALLFYQPLALIFGIIAAVRAWLYGYGRYSLGRRLSLWALAALILYLLYPSRQVGDLVWVLLPLWALAAMELARYAEVPSGAKIRLVSIAQAAFIFILFAFSWINLAALANASPALEQVQLRNALILLVSALLMAGLTSAMVAMGWSWEASRLGLGWGVGLALGVYILSGLWGSSQLRSNRVQELWHTTPGVGQADLLAATLGDLSAWSTGHRTQLDVTVIADSASLRWALRDWQQARFTRGLGVGDLPGAIITYQGQEDPRLAAAYRGQGFVWEEYRGWQGAIPPNWARWVAFRDAPRQENQLILWARSDLFPGGALEAEIDQQLEFDDLPEQDQLQPGSVPLE